MEGGNPEFTHLPAGEANDDGGDGVQGRGGDQWERVEAARADGDGKGRAAARGAAAREERSGSSRVRCGKQEAMSEAKECHYHSEGACARGGSKERARAEAREGGRESATGRRLATAAPQSRSRSGWTWKEALHVWQEAPYSNSLSHEQMATKELDTMSQHPTRPFALPIVRQTWYCN